MIRRGLLQARRLAVRRALFAPVATGRVMSRQMSLSTRRRLPAHELIPLPALSPTMEVGTIKSWEVSESLFKGWDNVTLKSAFF